MVPALLAALLYVPTLSHGFVWDDVPFIARNPAVREAGLIARSLTRGHGWVPGDEAPSVAVDGIGIEETARADERIYYRPLVALANGVQWSLSGGDPGVFHAFNLILHAGASALVAACVLLFAPPLAAALAGAIFAVHPMTVEAVAWISGRADLLVGLCGLGALLLLGLMLRERASATGTPRLRPWVPAALPVLFGLGLLAKESAVAVCALALALLSLAARGPGPRRPFVGAALGVVAVLALYAVARVSVLGSGATGDTGDGTTGWPLPGALFLLYLGRLLVPWRPTVEAPAWIDAPPAWVGALGLLLLAVTVVAWARLAWQWRGGSRSEARTALLIGGGLFLAALVPVLHWIPIGEVYGERFLYLPLAGLLIAGTPWLAPRGAGAAAIVVAAAAACLWISLERIPEWRDDVALFASAARDAPHRARTHASYGSALFLSGRLQEAETPLRRAVEMDPTAPLPRAQLGALLVNLGRAEAGVPHLEAALEHAGPSFGLLRNLGIGRLRAGDAAAARDALTEAVRASPEDARSWDALGSAQRQLGDLEAAETGYRRAIAADPTFKAAYLNLIGLLYFDAGSSEAALPVLEAFLARFPDAPEAPATRELLREATTPPSELPSESPSEP